MPRIVGDSSGYTFHLKQANGRYNQEATITLPSVTSVIKRTLAAPDLLRWYYRQTVDSISGLVATSSGYDSENSLSLQDILSDSMVLDEWLGENRMRPEDIGKEAMDRGSAEHATLEGLADTQMKAGVEAAEALARKLFENGKASGWQRGIADWWLAMRPEVIASEEVVYSLNPPYAGSLDLVAQVPEIGVALLDLKTRGPEGRAYGSDFVQVAAYEKAFVENSGQRVDGRYILVVRASGEWVMEEATVPFEAFAHLHALDEILRRIK